MPRFQGRKRVHNADEIMAEIVAKRLVEHLERAGFVIMKRRRSAGAPRSGGDSRADYGRKAIRRGCAGRLAAVTLAEQLWRSATVVFGLKGCCLRHLRAEKIKV